MVMGVMVGVGWVVVGLSVGERVVVDLEEEAMEAAEGAAVMVGLEVVVMVVVAMVVAGSGVVALALKQDKDHTPLSISFVTCCLLRK